MSRRRWAAYIGIQLFNFTSAIAEVRGLVLVATDATFRNSVMTGALAVNVLILIMGIRLARHVRVTARAAP